MNSDNKDENIQSKNEENALNELEYEHGESFKVTKTINDKNNNHIIMIITSIIIVLIMLVLSTGFAIANINNDYIIGGISIHGIKVEGLNQEQAINKLKETLNDEASKEITLLIGEETYSISPNQIETNYNIEKAVAEAYKIGRHGNIFINNYEIVKTLIKKENINIEISFNYDALINFLQELNAKLPNAVTENTYSIEDDELIITRGKSGMSIELEELYLQVINAIKNRNYEDIQVKTIWKNPVEIDIDKIHEEVYCEPQNAYFVKEPFELFQHKNGIDFDVEEAKEIIQEYKDEYIIPLEITLPKILTKDLGIEAFSDLLASYSTKYDEALVSRSTNVKLAVNKINNVMVMPGETFSYNKTLGKRTAEAGYKEAAGYAGGKVVQMIGGGICQVSSTLYDAVIYANLDVVERYNHVFVTGYSGAGKDATVSYGSLDFKFKNNRTYPIVIKATAKNGICEVKIYGIKEEVEYDIEIEVKVLQYTPYSVIYEDDSTMEDGQEKVSQYGANGCKSITYKIVKKNGVEISKTVLSTDTYKPMNKIIKRGTKVKEEVIEENDVNTIPTEGQEELETDIVQTQPEQNIIDEEKTNQIENLMTTDIQETSE